MKLSVTKKALKEAIETVKPLIPRSPQTKGYGAGVIGYFLLKAEAGKLLLCVNDMDASMSVPVEADVEVQGGCIVPADILSNIANKLPGTALKMALERDGLKCTAKRSRFKLMANTAASWPREMIPDEWSPEFLMLDGGNLRRLLEAVLYAASTDECKFSWQCVSLYADERSLYAAATDGHRMALSSLPRPELSGPMPAIAIPSDTVRAILQMCQDGEETRFSWGDGLIRVECNGSTLESTLIERGQPDYTPYHPHPDAQPLVVPRETLLDKVDLLGTISKYNTLQKVITVPVRLNPEDEGVLVSIEDRAGNHGEAIIEKPVPSEVVKLPTGYNPEYLHQALDKIDGSEVAIYYTGPKEPVHLLPHPPPPGVHKHVIMPMEVPKS